MPRIDNLGDSDIGVASVPKPRMEILIQKLEHAIEHGEILNRNLTDKLARLIGAPKENVEVDTFDAPIESVKVLPAMDSLELKISEMREQLHRLDAKINSLNVLV